MADDSLSSLYFRQLGAKAGITGEMAMYIKNLFSSHKMNRKESIKYVAAKIAYPAARRNQPREFLVDILKFLVDASTPQIIAILRNPKLDITVEERIRKTLIAFSEDEERLNHLNGYASEIVKLMRADELEVHNE